MTSPLEPLSFPRGPVMKNRFVLAPMTNHQSDEAGGYLGDDEYRWLTMRAAGGFGMVLTCAAHVQPIGKGFPRELGIFSDEHLPGLTRLAGGIKAQGSIAIAQLYHAGMRAALVRDLIEGQPVSCSDQPDCDARGLSLDETEQLIEDFVAAAARAARAGFDGIELHGAHGYIFAQFFSAEFNRRTDRYGGSMENRFRILFDIIAGIRSRCPADFLLGVRLSPERFGMNLGEVIDVSARLMAERQIDFLDLSLWDVFKMPEQPIHDGKSLLDHFVDLPRHGTRLGVAGKIRTPAQVEQVMASGVDWLMLGRAAIVEHDFPDKYATDQGFEPVALPLARAQLRAEGLNDYFIDHLAKIWPDAVA